jgi:hypothetical protein
MDVLIRKFEGYLKETLGLDTNAKIWTGSNKLPIYLRDRYIFYAVEILDQRFLLMVTREQIQQTPASIKKQLVAVRNVWDGETIFVSARVSAYDRKRLIEQKVSFVIPGNQIYLPMLGMDLREHFRKQKEIKHKFSPSTQAVVLNALLNPETMVYTPVKLAVQLGYAAMTLTRAFDELEALGVGEVKVKGRERVLYLEGSQEVLWNTTKQYMRNPIRKIHWVGPQNFAVGGGVKTGLSALSSYSMLSEPKQKTFAFSFEGWKILQQETEIVEVPSNEEEANRVEVWYYAPRLFAKNDIVDRFSLFLSLKDDKNERVQLALDEMMGDIKW